MAALPKAIRTPKQPPAKVKADRASTVF